MRTRARTWSLVRHERRVMPMDESSIRVTVGQLGSWRAVWPGDWPDRSLATKAALGGRASRRAVTRVNPEQALDQWSCGCRPAQRTGKAVRTGKRPTQAPVRSAGVVGTARRDGITGNVGDLPWVRDTPQRRRGRRPGQESERVISTAEAG
jgi:hypothetical protein